jgi:hypothetical protein
MKPRHHEQQQLLQPHLMRSMRSLLLIAVLAVFCLAGPAAAHSNSHTPAGRSLQATNRTARAAAGCAKPPSPELRQLLHDKLAAVNSAEAAKAQTAAAAAAAGEAGIAAAPTPGLQHASSITMGLVFHVISDPNVEVHVDLNSNNAVDPGETFTTAPHRAADPGDLPTCAHLKGKLLTYSH